jgi:ABC-type branched-subunit amino acid transport system substrate-binding protein
VRRRARHAGALVALGALLISTASCGARWSDEERAAVLTRHQGTPGASAPAPSGGAGGAGATGTGGSLDVAGGVASAGDGGGGTGPAADGAGGAGASGGPAPCEVASDAPGVTDREIRLGSISSLSGPVPGLGASSAAAARAYVAYRNATGGVCGRRVVLQEADDGTETARYRALVTDMAPKVFGLAGGFALGDVGGLDVIEQAKLPVVGIPGDDRGTALPTYFDLNPPFEDPDGVSGKYRYLYEQGVRTVTQVYLAVSQSRLEAQRQARQMRASGLQIVDVQELPLATLSYDAPARRVANSGADYLFFIGDARGNGAMARAMHDAGVDVQFAEYFTFSYGEGFIEQASPPAAEGAITWLRSLPNEEGGSNAELARFLEWMDRSAPGVVRDAFAVDSWATTKAFLDNLQALRGAITRAALIEQLRSVDTYDADGMYGPVRLGRELNNGCVVGMQVRDGRWRRMTPASGFLCDPP